MSVPSLTRFKCCTKCAVTYPATTDYFRRHAECKYGVHSQCKTCKCIHDVAYGRANPEVRRAAQKRWEARNPDYVSPPLSEASRQRKREYNDKWRAENVERQRENIRAWGIRNRDRRLTNTRNRRARLKAAEGKHSLQDILDMLASQGGLCAYCEGRLGDGYEVDHMTPVSRGGTNDWSNLAITCATCNRQKHVKTAEEFMCQATLKWQPT